MQRVLIAGCGYVGRVLAATLVQQGGYEVYCLTRRPPVEPLPGATWLTGDLVAGALDHLPQGLDRVVYAAAPGGGGEEAYEQIYVHGLGRLLRHVEGSGRSGWRALLTSSTSVYGEQHGEWVDETTLPSASAYSGRLVYRGEQLLRPGDTAVRFGGIYGPGRTAFVESVRQGTLTVNREHSAYTNRIHRDDAAGILAFLLAHPQPATVYNGVDTLSATRADVALWLAARLGVQVNTSEAAETSTFLRGNKRCSSERLQQAGYRFLYPTYREGYASLLGP